MSSIRSGLAILAVLAATQMPRIAYADMFGGDLVYLAQILAENIKHYYQLKQMIQEAQETKDYLRFINAGIDNSIGLIQSLPIRDEKLLAELSNFQGAVGKVSELYGQVPKSPEEAMQMLHDNSIAESLRMVNSFKDYSINQETNAQRIAVQSREASPKGAMRMQAETSAQILDSLAQLIRLNTQMLKMQSEQFGMANKTGKESVASFQKVNRDLGKSFQNFSPEMKLVRF